MNNLKMQTKDTAQCLSIYKFTTFTLGIAQANLALLSLNSIFDHVSLTIDHYPSNP